tara:strand:- start:103291 stop:103869 length:579 start_codon:yes stop_codon:yes gene_type:complete
MKIFKTLTAIVFASSLLVACSGGVQYTDPGAVDTTGLGFGSTDLQTTVQTMVSGLLTFPPVVQLTSKERPILFVAGVKNTTNQQINTDMINNMMMTQLIQSGKFRFTDMSVVKKMRDQLNYQSDSGNVDPQSVIKIGQQVGAQYMLYGSVSAIEKSGDGKTSMYFLVSMRLMNIKTGIVEWADQKQIRKVQS